MLVAGLRLGPPGWSAGTGEGRCQPGARERPGRACSASPKPVTLSWVAAGQCPFQQQQVRGGVKAEVPGQLKANQAGQPEERFVACGVDGKRRSNVTLSQNPAGELAVTVGTTVPYLPSTRKKLPMVHVQFLHQLLEQLTRYGLAGLR